MKKCIEINRAEVADKHRKVLVTHFLLTLLLEWVNSNISPVLVIVASMDKFGEGSQLGPLDTLPITRC